MNKKRLVIYLVVLSVLGFSMVYKAGVIKQRNSAKKVTVASIWKETGIPVHVAEVKRGTVPRYMKATVKIIEKKILEITLPATVRPFLSDKFAGDIIIEGRRFSGRRGKVSSVSLDYTGFLSMKAFLKHKLPWKNGSLKVGRIPYFSAGDGGEYLHIPNGAIYSDSKGSWIFSVKNGVLNKKSVQIILGNHLNTAVDGELIVGEKIVVSDQRDLASGLRVNPIEL
ncbi:MAG: hypothetical protein KAG61_10965 [Bacteriovoracaceae bacterium]|nr:hypothetical protein [Bacteriovoracaceae bacterium]